MSLLVAALLLVLPGCVTRKLSVRSEPPGAEVLLDGRTVGTTPYEEDFLSYGVRRLELRLPGFQRHIEDIDVWRPWWQVFPFSLMTDVLWPFEIVDERVFEVRMETIEPMDSAQIEAAAKAAYEKLRLMRQRAADASADHGP